MKGWLMLISGATFNITAVITCHTGIFSGHCSGPSPALKHKLDTAVKRLYAYGSTLVAIHMRRGDYHGLGWGPFVIAPPEWYRKWLDGVWDKLYRPVLFIASDSPGEVSGEFDDFRPLFGTDLGVDLSPADFYPEFYVLTQADMLAISNSTFSFVASMLNTTAKGFFRPDFTVPAILPFMPRDSEILPVWKPC